MAYYDLSKTERLSFLEKMELEIQDAILKGETAAIEKYAADPDTYIRKNCYLLLGKLFGKEKKMRPGILSNLDRMSLSDNEKIRQTIIYALGEIGKIDFNPVKARLEFFLNDSHHTVRNGLTGAIKQAGNKNPGPIIKWVHATIPRCDADMQKRLVHGLELWGRKHPEDIFVVLRSIHYDRDKGIRKMLIHIMGQISYKKGCIEKVVNELKNWSDKTFVEECKKEIIQVHMRYAKFSSLSPDMAERYVSQNLCR